MLNFNRLYPLMVLLLPTLPLLAQNTPDNQSLTLEQVLENYQTALGGAEAIAAVKSVFILGKTLASENSPEMPFKAWYEPGKNRLRLEYIYTGVPGVISYDGEHGWMIPPVVSNRQPRPMTGVDLLQIREQADFFGPLIHSGQKNVTLKLLSPVTEAGRLLQRIEVQRSFKTEPAATGPESSGDEPAEEITESSIWKLDSESWLLVAVDSDDRMADGQIQKLQVRYSDYQPVGPIVWPHHVTTDTISGESQGEAQVNVLETVLSNVPLDDVEFDLSASPR